jgi:hypothetical protein
MRISFVLSLVLFVCLSSFGQESEVDQVEPAPSLTVLGGVELCGPAAPAEEYLLSALSEICREKYLKERAEIKPDNEGMMNLRFNRAPVVLRFDGFAPYSVNLQTIDDQVLAVVLYYRSASFYRDIYKDAIRKLTQQKGKPERAGTAMYIWVENGKTTLLRLSIRDNMVYISFACTELLRKSTAAQGGPSMTGAGRETKRKWLKQSRLQIASLRPCTFAPLR